jgi:hypothetical protein
MPSYRLPNVFNDQDTYNHTTLPDTDADAECLICKSPYFPHDPEGCQAIQLQPCGHIIGRQYFDECLLMESGSCLYCMHNLPRALKASASEEGLTAFCPLGPYEAVRRALDALVKGTLTHEDVSLLIKWSYMRMCCVTVYLGLLLMVHNILMLSFCSGTVLVHMAAFHVFLWGLVFFTRLRLLYDCSVHFQAGVAEE